MASFQSKNQAALLTHAALVGLTPLIPIPFVDDMAKDYLQRRLVQTLANTHDLTLTAEDIKVLGDDASKSWVGGAAKTVALFPLKLMLRKTFLILQGKRVIDSVSECLHRGFLLDLAFENRWCAPAGSRQPAEVRAAIDAVCREVPTKPLDHAVRAGFARSKIAVKKASEMLERSLKKMTWSTFRRGPRESLAAPAEQDVARVVELMAKEETLGAAGLSEQLRKALADVPTEHFERLQRLLTEKLTPRS